MADDSGEPYRGSALETRPPAPLATAPPRSPRAPLVVLGAIPLYAALCAVGFVPWHDIRLVSLCAGLVAVALRAVQSHTRAEASVAALPFPIHHDPADAPASSHVAKVREVRISLAGRLDPTTADHRAVEAEAQVEGLKVTMWSGDGVILLTGWRAPHDDLAALATLLDTWGRRVHACAPISDVRVAWTPRPMLPR